MMVYLFINGASSIMDASCGYSFVGWAGSKVHEKLAQPGEALGLGIYGEQEWANTRPDIRAAYIVVPGLIVGLVVGVLVGVARLMWSRRKRLPKDAPDSAASSTTFEIPAFWPLGLAFLGVLFFGHFLGLLAVLLLNHSRACIWLRCATWVVGLGAALLWGAGQELPFEEGWSMLYPWAQVFYFVR
jgi:hypothetical protein